MVEEMTALHSTGTWNLVALPHGKSSVGCHLIYKFMVDLKISLGGQGAYTDLWI